MARCITFMSEERQHMTGEISKDEVRSAIEDRLCGPAAHGVTHIPAVTANSLEETHITVSLVETLTRQYQPSVVVTRDKVVKLAVVHRVLVRIRPSVIVTPLPNIVTVPPKLVSRYLLLYYSVLAISETVFAMIYCINT